MILKRLFHWVIIVFCLWHMYSVWIYIIPDEVAWTPIRKMVDVSGPYVRPYMNATSQWQKWNIFAPEPIRRVSAYQINIEENGSWKRQEAFLPLELPWLFRTKELKVLRMIEDWKPLAENYLRDYCRRKKLPEGTHLQIVSSSYVLPTKKELEQQGGYANYRKQFWGGELGDIQCPPSVE